MNLHTKHDALAKGRQPLKPTVAPPSPPRRPAFASALAADLRRYLAGEPVVARPPTFSYRAGKFIRRRKGPVTAAAAVLLALGGGLAAATTLYMRERAALTRESGERAKAQRESANNAQTAKFLSDMLAGASPDMAKGKVPTLLDIVESAAKRLGTGLPDQPAVEASLRNIIGSTWYSLGRYPEAKTQFAAGLKLALAALGEKDRLTLRLRDNLANILKKERDYAKAEAGHRAILVIRLSEFPPDDIETLATRGNLAGVIAKQEDRFDEAVAEYRALLPSQQKALGAGHADTLRTRIALANILSYTAKGDAAKLAEAETEYRGAIAVMEQSPDLGPKHPQTLETRYGLADVLYYQKKYPDAEKEHRAVQGLRADVLGANHEKTPHSRAGTARAIAQQEGCLAEAIAEFKAVIAAQQAAPQRDEERLKINLQWLQQLEADLRAGKK